MTDLLVQKVIKAYADLNAITRGECISLGLDEKKADALSKAFDDGFINADERGKLTSAGFSSQFITDLNISNALLQRVKWLADKGLKDHNPSVRAHAGEALRYIGPSAKYAIPALFAALNDPVEVVRAYAIDGLYGIGPAAKEANPIPLLGAALKDSAENVRWRAACAIGEIDPAAATKDIISDLIKMVDIEIWNDSRFLKCRFHATYTLGRIGPAAKNARWVLIKALKNEQEDERVRCAAAFALSEICPEEPAVVSALYSTLNDKNAVVRACSAKILGKLRPANKGVVYRLSGLLRDQEAEIRANAAFALGEIGALTKNIVPEIIALLNDPDASVRKSAALALSKIGPAAKNAETALKERLAKEQDADVCKAIMDALRNITP